MTELVLTRGIPASGKTTWARAWVAENELGRARVNRDDLRLNLFGRPAPLPYELERIITVAQHAAVSRLLGGSIDVVVDDTNLHLKYVREYAQLAAAMGATFRLEDFDVPLDVCIERDLDRKVAREPGYVGEEVIRKMHERWQNAKRHGLADLELPEDDYRYEPDESLPPAWIFDVDGTLALNLGGRSPFDWGRVGEDDLNTPVCAIARAFHLADLALPAPETRTGRRLLVLSGRDEVCRPQTEDWLERHGVPYDDLFMRPAGDSRKDSIVKLELFREHVAPHYRVLGVFDDRQQVVDMWRRVGLFCAQVAPGDF